ncbi:hypothetical protein NX773_19490 [Massilia solisilvae]|uniref:Laminin IV type B domain-containing protein n=1 Tax=Massilia solisilvae TaxID=1811225 RepID=A0ABT2BPF4_9BURK|nr:hypothetical protein [Massilia solisilvae]MCS0610355.1 hypothetical protein [Massilia solisilvae]
MTVYKVASLNAGGISVFSSWLAAPKGEPPLQLLSDPAFTDDLPWDFSVDTEKTFDTSYDLGLYLHTTAIGDVKDPLAVERATGMWAWLSLAMIRSLVRRTGVQKGKPLESAHYVEADTQRGRRLGYRLITRTAWRLVRLHGEKAQVALGSARSPWGEMAEQMSSRQEIFSHPSFWAVAHKLYRNEHGELKRGATSQRPESARKDPNNNSGKGGVRRLPATFRQFDRTYLTRAMTLDQMLQVLPNEYERWIS